MTGSTHIRASHSHGNSGASIDVVPQIDSNVPVWKNCVYFARGYCKHGSSCRFVHAVSTPVSPQQNSATVKTQALSSAEEVVNEASPDSLRSTDSWLPQLQTELQDLLLAQTSPVTVASLPQLYAEKYGKSLLTEGPLVEGLKNGRNMTSLLKLLGKLKSNITLFDRSDGQKVVVMKRTIPSKIADTDMSPYDWHSSRQIYLTFPAESTFTESDVASHFGLFGGVNDVRIPYQQKRMFGFVTFGTPSAVKAVLKQGNPHFICGSRVLVKPYREKGKAAERSKYGELSRGTFSEPVTLGKSLVIDSKTPPRQLITRSESRLVYAARGSPGTTQAWVSTSKIANAQLTQEQARAGEVSSPIKAGSLVKALGSIDSVKDSSMKEQEGSPVKQGAEVGRGKQDEAPVTRKGNGGKVGGALSSESAEDVKPTGTSPILGAQLKQQKTGTLQQIVKQDMSPTVQKGHQLTSPAIESYEPKSAPTVHTGPKNTDPVATEKTEPYYTSPAVSTAQQYTPSITPAKQPYTNSEASTGKHYTSSPVPAKQTYASSPAPTGVLLYASSPVPAGGQHYASSPGPTGTQHYASSPVPTGIQRYASSPVPAVAQHYTNSAVSTGGQYSNSPTAQEAGRGSEVKPGEPEGSPMESSPLPVMRLFKDADQEEGVNGFPITDIQQTEDNQCPFDEWNIDLESILPDSPFSSPKRAQANSSTYNPSMGSTADNSHVQDWHPSSIPGAYHPSRDGLVYGHEMMYTPHMSNLWSAADSTHAKYPQAYGYGAVKAGADITPVSTLEGNMYFSGASPMVNKAQEYSAPRTVCMTCRQQQVAIPNSQCACCQLILCQTGTHAPHGGVPELTPSWQMPMHAYVGASPQ